MGQLYSRIGVGTMKENLEKRLTELGYTKHWFQSKDKNGDTIVYQILSRPFARYVGTPEQK